MHLDRARVPKIVRNLSCETVAAFSAVGPAQHPEDPCAQHEDDDSNQVSQRYMRDVTVSTVDVQEQETTDAASEDRPDEQGEDVVHQPEGYDEDHAEGKDARQEK